MKGRAITPALFFALTMPKRKASKKSGRSRAKPQRRTKVLTAESRQRRRALWGLGLAVLASLILIALVSWQPIDDDRLSGRLDSRVSPFDLPWNNWGGLAGAWVAFVLRALMGWLAFFIPLGLVLAAVRLARPTWIDRIRLHAWLLFAICLLGTVIYNLQFVGDGISGLGQPTGGGWLGRIVALAAVNLVGSVGSYIVLVALIVAMVMLYTSIVPWLARSLNLPWGEWFRRLYRAFATVVARLIPKRMTGAQNDAARDDYDDEREVVAADPEPISIPTQSELLDLDVEQHADEPSEPPDSEPKAAPAPRGESVQIGALDYAFPNSALLSANAETGPSVSSDEIAMNARLLEETLDTFNVRITGAIEGYPGPVITRYEFKPAPGVKVSQIVNLADDLALAMQAKRIRIVAPIPGKAAVGIEIPNRRPQMVHLREIVESGVFRESRLRLPLALGKTIAGQPFVADLAKMPHLLIAGATGSGKSVCMNVLITSLMYRLHPMQIKFIFIDPKMLELSVYSGIPHLARSVVTKSKQAEKVLADTVTEMENRYRKLATANVRNIEDYNRKQVSEEDKLPYIVVCVDELADLMMSAQSSKTELLITRLAQMARAVGIHLILATQRPSVDVITGLIKANFPARIAFAVSSKVDSRTILDANGAEKLLGQGDMLFQTGSQPEAIRIHGAFLSTEETESIVTHIKEQNLDITPPESLAKIGEEATGDEGGDWGDPLFREAVEVCVRMKQGSVSLLQRRLGIGYQRAARLIDKLEEAGVVSPFDGSKARDVLVDKSYLEDMNQKVASN